MITAEGQWKKRPVKSVLCASIIFAVYYSLQSAEHSCVFSTKKDKLLVVIVNSVILSIWFKFTLQVRVLILMCTINFVLFQYLAIGATKSGIAGFNVASNSAFSKDLKSQAQELISRIKRNSNANIRNDWKVHCHFNSLTYSSTLITLTYLIEEQT